MIHQDTSGPDADDMSKLRAKSSAHHAEVAAGDRFRFGANWLRFVSKINNERHGAASESLRQRIEQGMSGSVYDPAANLANSSRFLDIGCGSGMFSLAAWRMGASVVSIDYDPDSVACTSNLRERNCPRSERWQILESSVLDSDAMEALGKFDVVYAWGSLHHTGQMWNAIKEAFRRVSPGGLLILAIYNDQGFRSDLWRGVKRLYCTSAFGRIVVLAITLPYFYSRSIIGGLIRGRSLKATLTSYSTNRGMSQFHDIVDWVGGLPFEVARPSAVELFATSNGFELQMLQSVGRAHGNNEYVFRRTSIAEENP